jgi:hypothetical protein
MPTIKMDIDVGWGARFTIGEYFMNPSKGSKSETIHSGKHKCHVTTDEQGCITCNHVRELVANMLREGIGYAQIALDEDLLHTMMLTMESVQLDAGLSAPFYRLMAEMVYYQD